MSSNPVKDLLIEFEDYQIYSKWLLENKGANYTPADCYRIVQWFKGDNPCHNPTQAAIFRAGHQIAKYMIFCTEQMDDLYELWYGLKYGIKGLPEKELPK